MTRLRKNQTYEWATGLRPGPASEIKTPADVQDEHFSCDVLLALEDELDIACENPFA
jgi:hypothetical protein